MPTIAGHDFVCDARGVLHWGYVHTVVAGNDGLPASFRAGVCIGMVFHLPGQCYIIASGDTHEESFHKLVDTLRSRQSIIEQQLEFEATGLGVDRIRKVRGGEWWFDPRGAKDWRGKIDYVGAAVRHSDVNRRHDRHALVVHLAELAGVYKQQVAHMVAPSKGE